MVLRKQELKNKWLLLSLSLVSASLLAAAFWFEFVDGLAPCKLCIWQRWPHAGVVLMGLLSFTALRPSMLIGLAILLLITTGSIGMYHAGVEYGIFAGPDSCTVDLKPMSLSEGLDKLLATPVIRCDEVVWRFVGLSMASWNSIVSFSAALIAFILMRRI